MKRRSVANLLGWLSVACSLAFWILLAIGTQIKAVRGVFESPRSQWVVLASWPMAFLLAGAAAFMGARWWLLAVLLAVISAWAFLCFVAGP